MYGHDPGSWTAREASPLKWIALPEKDAATDALERRLWDAADQLRANSGLKSSQHSAPVLGLIFLRFAEVRFSGQRAKLEKGTASARRGSCVDEPKAYHADGVLHLVPEARYGFVPGLPEGADVGKAVNDAMRAVQKHNPQISGVLPKTYAIFEGSVLKELLKTVSEIGASHEYEAEHRGNPRNLPRVRRGA